ncbi:hypothetical protein M413DRAFT_41781, partial [Hebeloma cylindrosporum]
MPEIIEIMIAGKLVRLYIDKTGPEDRLIKNIFADATVAEAPHHPPNSPAASGHVYPLASSSTIRRGEGDQSPLFPPEYASCQNLSISTHRLILQSVESTPRSLILEFTAQ